MGDVQVDRGPQGSSGLVGELELEGKNRHGTGLN